MTSPPVVLAAVPTLFSPDGELDRDANRALYKLVCGQLDGLLVAGTTGEGILLTVEERKRLAERFIEAAHGLLAVAVHCPAACMEA